MAAVRLLNVSKTFPGGRHAAVRDVSLEIGEREFFSLLGPSGCGKSTTLRMIAGFESPDAGEVWLCGERADRTPPHRRPVHMVFQTYALFPHLTVEQNVAFPLKMAGVPRAERAGRVQDALARVGMRDFERRLPSALSGGQRQRVALARAMVDRPQVLLLDEPLGALDLQLRQQMQKFLKEVQHESGIAFVYVTHDQGEALAMSDRVAVMHAGAVEQIGAPRDIYDRPATRFVAGFIGRTNLLDGTVERAPEGPVLRAGGLALVVAGDGGGAPGPRTLSLRPERIRLGPDAARCRNRFTGTVAETYYAGAQTEVQVRVAGATLAVAVPGGAVPAPGTEVEIGWEPEDGRLV